MTETGKVINKKGTYVTVRFMRKSACGDCGMCAMKPGDPHIDIELKNTVGAEINDEVEVNMSGSVVKASFAAYILPLVFGIAAMLIAYFLSVPEWAIFFSLLAGVGIGYIPLRVLDRKWGKKKLQPEIVSVIKKKIEEVNDG